MRSGVGAGERVGGGVGAGVRVGVGVRAGGRVGVGVGVVITDLNTAPTITPHMRQFTEQ